MRTYADLKNKQGKILNTKQIQMTKIQKAKQYDLEERVLQLAKRTRQIGAFSLKRSLDYKLIK